MNRDWAISTQKAANAIVEGLAFEVIRQFYASRGILDVRVDYNSALDLTGKQAFDLIATGKDWQDRWEIKSDKKWAVTGNVFIEHLGHWDFDYLLFFAFFPYVIPRERYLGIITDAQYPIRHGGDYHISKGSLVTLQQLAQLSL